MRQVDVLANEWPKLVQMARNSGAYEPEDAVQDVSVYLCRKKLLDEPAHYGYLRMAIKNSSLKQHDPRRRRYNRSEDIQVLEATPAISNDARVDFQIDLKAGIEGLTNKQQVIVVGLVSGYNVREIAERGRISERTVRKQITSARKKLRRALA